MINLNEEINKSCPNCEQSFKGDETVKGEYCSECLKRKSDYVCNNCGNPIFEEDEVSVKRECTVEKVDGLWDALNSNNRIDEIFCKDCK